MISIAICGHKGKLGSAIISQLQQHPDFSVVPIERDSPIPTCDVVIDVSTTAGLTSLLSRLDSTQKLLIGTTGNLPWEDITTHSHHAPVYVVSNFAPGAIAQLQSLATITQSMTHPLHATITEKHHADKIDSPSGTALRLQQELRDNNVSADIVSLREGAELGEHTVVLSNKYEQVEIRHTACSREVYAHGCIDCILKIIKQPVGLVVE